MLIDVHCHLDHHLYKKDIKDVLKRIESEKMMVVTAGIDDFTNKLALKLAENKNIFATLGFYPADALDREGYFEENPDVKLVSAKDEADFMRKNKSNPKFIGIGEVGLDLFNGKNLERQKSDFREFIEVAIELDKPLIIHSRKAEKESLDVLSEFSKLKAGKVILHCFSGKRSLIKQAIEKGYCFSIPTNIVRAENFQYLVEVCPLSQILTETDAPYLSPYKNEDGSFNKNEPIYVKESIKVIARIKKLNEKEVGKAIEANFKRIFGVKV